MGSCMASAADSDSQIDGVVSIVWGDAQETDKPAHVAVFLATDDGEVRELAVPEELKRGNVSAWQGRRVRVALDPSGPRFAENGALRIQGFEFLDGPVLTRGITGSRPWVSLLCKFSDIADEPEDLSYFQEMYNNAPGRLDHYMREISYDAVDLVGATAVAWVTLPGTQSSYVPTPGSGTGADLNAVFDDCTAAADAMIDFSAFDGINIMLNERLDCCAWGGGRFATLDGVSKVWRTAWNPPWAYASTAVIAHEMGHGLGLPHANNFDDDGNPYDSPWDVMSSATGYAVSDATYGRQGKHFNAYHKDQLGWFASARRFEAPLGSLTSIELDSTELQNATAYQIAIIPVDASHWYTVEARRANGDYEAEIPGDAVIIHQIDTGRSEPAWAVDADLPPADYGDNPGTMWLPGEEFVDLQNRLRLTVDSTTANGFAITIDRRLATPTIAAPATPQNAPFAVTIDFGESVANFVVDDLTITNGSASNFSDNGAGQYSATITGDADGEITIEVADAAAEDAGGNATAASNSVSVVYDQTPPAPLLAGPSGVQTGLFDISIDFGETVEGFALSDLAISGGSASGLMDLGNGEFQASVTPTGTSDTVQINLPAASATDLAGNENGAADTLEVSVIGITGSVDLAIAKFNGVDVLNDGDTTRYTIVVSNGGPDDATGVAVTDLLPSTLVDGQWTCMPVGQASCAAFGSGDIDDTATLAVSSMVIYELTATVNAGSATTIANSATVTPPGNRAELDSSDNVATDSDGVGLFVDGFE